MESLNKNIDEISEDDLDTEIVELEFDEESVAYYIVDENDVEIGVCLFENGEEVEYMYEDVAEEAKPLISDELREKIKNKAQDTKQNLNEMKNELLDVKEDAVEISQGVKDTVEDLQNTVDKLKDSVKIFPFKK